MMKRWLPNSAVGIFLCAAVVTFGGRYARAATPNVLILYADDLGYGDLGCYNANSKIPTPNLDRLASEGVRFTDGHCSSGICTPSRYALLTGRYHWRKFHDIVQALGPSKFDRSRLTLPEMFQRSGYATACVGKWHLGWDWDAIKLAGMQAQVLQKGRRKKRFWTHDSFDWSRPIPDGPLDHGFDYYFGDTVINFPPYTWIENNRVVDVPDKTLTITAKTKEGGWEARPGPAHSDWDFYENLPTLTDKAVAWLTSRKDNPQPFFFYFPLPSPHAPIVPTAEFDGKSSAGPYGDYVVQSDWSCGRLLDALKSAGHLENTIVVFTADNGPEKYAYPRDEKLKHWSADPLRGLKRDIYEGGHRVPFLIRWPGKIEAGSVSDELVSQIDLMATLAAILNYNLPEDAAEDSHNLLPMFNGETGIRKSHVHNTRQNQFAIRQGDWVLIDHKNGYMSGRNKEWEARRGFPQNDDHSQGQLFNLAEDLGQRHNVIDEHPEKAQALRLLLQCLKKQGHSAPRLDDRG